MSYQEILEAKIDELQSISRSISIDSLFSDMLEHSDFKISDFVKNLARSRTASFLCQYADELVHALNAMEREFYEARHEQNLDSAS